MNTEGSSLLDRATRMAVDGHAIQVRKDDNSPYIVHPVMVAILLAQHGFSETVIAAGLTHDLVEDTEYTIDQIREELGDEVATIVASVTNQEGLTWEDKKRAYVETVRIGSEDAKAVATADKIHNAESLIRAHDRLGTDLWKLFNAGREKKLWFEDIMLAMLKETWQHPLVDEYEALVQKMNALT
ncbi:MAG: GTP pyrophosphokinase, (p)ppGpp synthetase I [Parcubacteria bacterium C7867-008]|nr:MAG: GTP pyrophosphokinase, (p)ppGpp synthetase I [Parcubacteria bacterium C7867-008]